MANKHKGETTVEIDGKTYTLALTLNAMCELEDLLSTPEKDVTFIDVLQSVTQKRSTRNMRALFWASLREHHPEVTVKAAGALIQEMGGIMAFTAQLPNILSSTRPDAEDAEAVEQADGPRPLKAQGAAAGTGGSSPSKLAASA